MTQLKKMKNTVAHWLALFMLLCGCSGYSRTPGIAVSDAAPVHAKTEPAPAATQTEWLIILINGQKSGYVQSTRTCSLDKVITETVTLMAMKRGRVLTEIRSVSTVEETVDGTPIKIVKETSGAGMAQKTTGIILPNGRLRLTTEAGGQINSREIDWPKGALMTEGQRLEAIRYGLEEGVTYTSTYFDPDLLEAIPVTIVVGKKTPLNLMGQRIEGIHVKLTMRIRGNALDLDTYVDEQMNTLKTVTNRMGMSVEMIACSEQVAKGETAPAEIVLATFVSAPKPLTVAQREQPITYTVRRISKAPLAIIATDEQIPSPKGEMLELRIVKKGIEKGGALPYQGQDPAILEALESSSWIQSDAADIVALAEIARGDATASGQAAKNISAFVNGYIKEKNFEVGYASALEVAKSRQGDCTEHALLTAALCRASGIPAQVVFGLVYVEQFEDKTDVFGGHAWTRVFVDGEWISLDAAVGKFDTAHIALAVSIDGNPADFFQITEIIGDIEIVSID